MNFGLFFFFFCYLPNNEITIFEILCLETMINGEILWIKKKKGNRRVTQLDGYKCIENNIRITDGCR